MKTRRFRSLCALGVTLACAAALGPTAGTAHALPRTCRDFLVLAQQETDIGNGYVAMGNAMTNLGYYQLASDNYDAAHYYFLAASENLREARGGGC